MKTNTLHLVNLFCTSLAIAFILVIVTAKGTAFAQNTRPLLNESNFNDLNGLFSPTAAEIFFEEGRRNMEREAQILEAPERYFGKGILQVNTIDMKIIEESGETKPIDNFPEDIPRYELE